jgi:hypothetical protein
MMTSQSNLTVPTGLLHMNRCDRWVDEGKRGRAEGFHG